MWITMLLLVIELGKWEFWEKRVEHDMTEQQNMSLCVYVEINPHEGVDSVITEYFSAVTVCVCVRLQWFHCSAQTTSVTSAWVSASEQRTMNFRSGPWGRDTIWFPSLRVPTANQTLPNSPPRCKEGLLSLRHQGALQSHTHRDTFLRSVVGVT